MPSIIISIPQTKLKVKEEKVFEFLKNEENLMRFFFKRITDKKVTDEIKEQMTKNTIEPQMQIYTGDDVFCSFTNEDVKKEKIRKTEKKDRYCLYIGPKYYEEEI